MGFVSLGALGLSFVRSSVSTGASLSTWARRRRRSSLGIMSTVRPGGSELGPLLLAATNHLVGQDPSALPVRCPGVGDGAVGGLGGAPDHQLVALCLNVEALVMAGLVDTGLRIISHLT